MSRSDGVEALLSTQGRALTRYAYLLCGNTQDAEDLVQDALVKTFVRHRSGPGPDAAEAYVRRTILTLYIDGWRRRVRWAERLHLLPGPASTDGPEQASTDRLDVMAALRGLPRQQRAAVVLRYYDDLTVPEIATQLGVSGGAVKRYLSLGVQKLEAALGPIEHRDGTTQLIQETPR